MAPLANCLSVTYGKVEFPSQGKVFSWEKRSHTIEVSLVLWNKETTRYALCTRVVSLLDGVHECHRKNILKPTVTNFIVKWNDCSIHDANEPCG